MIMFKVQYRTQNQDWTDTSLGLFDDENEAIVASHHWSEGFARRNPWPETRAIPENPLLRSFGEGLNLLERAMK